MISRRYILSGLVGSVVGLLSLGTSFALPAQSLTVQTEHGIPYVSGGVSLQERQTLRQMSKDDNVQLIFSAKNRDYLSDVAVRITDAKGHEVFNTVTQGPWLMMKLPAGQYHILATTKGHAQGTTFAVPSSGRSKTYLTWKDNVLKS
jgi:hypothetical protein